MDILIVEDERALLESLVEGVGMLLPAYRVVGVWSAEEAEPLISTVSPRLIIGDIRLPGKDGLEFYLALQDRRPDLKLILMSAYPFPVVEERVLASGGIRLVKKPFDLTALVQAVEEALAPGEAGRQV